MQVGSLTAYQRLRDLLKTAQEGGYTKGAFSVNLPP
jgi:hypothetical protein